MAGVTCAPRFFAAPHKFVLLILPPAPGERGGKFASHSARREKGESTARTRRRSRYSIKKTQIRLFRSIKRAPMLGSQQRVLCRAPFLPLAVVLTHSSSRSVRLFLRFGLSCEFLPSAHRWERIYLWRESENGEKFYRRACATEAGFLASILGDEISAGRTLKMEFVPWGNGEIGNVIPSKVPFVIQGMVWLKRNLHIVYNVMKRFWGLFLVRIFIKNRSFDVCNVCIKISLILAGNLAQKHERLDFN